uniref:Alpha-ketoglutarate-dependent dioxygenase AlkB-like domain-containing protein n=1 Tax=Plectus sambesii TaxID=2011161 RepID=A0A914WLR3_9BILA
MRSAVACLTPRASVNYYQVYHKTRPPRINSSKESILIALGLDDGCYVELDVGITSKDWKHARKKLKEMNHRWHFFDNRWITPPENDEDKKSYFPKGCSVDDVLELAKKLITTVAPTWLEPREDNKRNDVMRAALFYKSSEVVGYHSDERESYVLQICLRKFPDEPCWKICSIFPGEDLSCSLIGDIQRVARRG